MTPDGPNGPMAAPPEWEAIARFLDGESDAAESARMREWLAAHPGDGQLLDELEQRIGEIVMTRSATPASEIDVEAALRKVTARRGAAAAPLRLSPRRGVRFTSTPARWRSPALAAAAAVVVLVGGALWWRSLGRAGEASGSGGDGFVASTIATRMGERDSVRLPDGSLAVLGPQTTLALRAFGPGTREVELDGEAYFRVNHEAARPFLVRAGGAIVRDIGTAFTVRTAATHTRVAVIDGAVELRPTAGRGAVVLRRGDVGVLRSDGTTEARRGDATDADTAWIRGRLVFRDAPLSDVAREVRRWYGIDLRFGDTAVARKHYTGEFSGAPAERVLDDIALSLGARLERRGDTAVLRGGMR